MLLLHFHHRLFTTVMLEFWKREEAGHAWRWGVLGYESDEEAWRPAYAKAVAARGGKEPTYRCLMAKLASGGVCVVMLGVADGAAFACLEFQEYANAAWVGPEWPGAWAYAKSGPLVLYCVVVGVLGATNRAVSIACTRPTSAGT